MTTQAADASDEPAGALPHAGLDAARGASRMASPGVCRPHDLLHVPLLQVPVFSLPADAPAWVGAALARAPFVVVRRAEAPPGCVAVGVRGESRGQRYGSFVPVDRIDAIVSPEALLLEPYACADTRRDLPAFAALSALSTSFAPLRAYAWGPAGSAGFELVSRVATVTRSSDLDLLIRAVAPVSRQDAARLSTALQVHGDSFGIRIDAQLDTPAGGVALAEWAAGGERVLVRSSAGPRFSADPWSA